MTTPSSVIQQVCTLRCAFPHYGLRKLQVLLAEEGIVIGHATIGKIIRRFDLPRAPCQSVARKKRRERKTRLPGEFEAKKPGDLVSMDTVVIQENGKQKDIITALDHATRMALARASGTHSSTQAKDLLERMQVLLGRPVRKVLTDNGSACGAHYDQCCQDRTSEHCWTYPRSPKMNAHTKQFNRTMQEKARFPPFSASLEEWNAWIAHDIHPRVQLLPASPITAVQAANRFLRGPVEAPKSKEQSNMYVGHTCY